MNSYLKSILLALTCFSVVTSMTGCKTVKGVGQDMQHLGNKIEGKADEEARY